MMDDIAPTALPPFTSLSRSQSHSITISRSNSGRLPSTHRRSPSTRSNALQRLSASHDILTPRNTSPDRVSITSSTLTTATTPQLRKKANLHSIKFNQHLRGIPTHPEFQGTSVVSESVTSSTRESSSPPTSTDREFSRAQHSRPSSVASAARRPPASHSSYGVETRSGPPASYDTQRTLSQEKVWPANRGGLLRTSAVEERGFGSGSSADQPENEQRITALPSLSGTLHIHSSPDTADTQSIPTPTDADGTAVMEVAEDHGLGVFPDQEDGKDSSDSKSEDLFLNIAKADATRPPSSRTEKRRTRISLPFMSQTQPRPSTSHKYSSPVRSTFESSNVPAQAEVPTYFSKRSSLGGHVPGAFTRTSAVRERIEQFSKGEERANTSSVRTFRKADTAGDNKFDHLRPTSRANSTLRLNKQLPVEPAHAPNIPERSKKRTLETPTSERHTKFAIDGLLSERSQKRALESANSDRPQRFTASSALSDRPKRLNLDSIQSEKPKLGEYMATESTISTTAPSTVWDELDDLKYRIKKLEVTGKLPPSSAAAMSSVERPRTATTAPTTLSNSPKPNKDSSPLQATFDGIPANVHPLLHEALNSAKHVVAPEVYQKLHSTAQDALQLAAMMTYDSQVLRSGMPPTTERQIRRRTESMCRSLTELTIALAAETRPPPSSFRPDSSSKYISPNVTLRSRRYSNEPQDHPPVAARVESRLATNRRSSLIYGQTVTSQPSPDEGNLPEPTALPQLPSPRAGRTSTALRNRRSLGYGDGTNNVEEPSSNLRPSSRAKTDSGRRMSRDPTTFSREYTSQHPLPVEIDNEVTTHTASMPINIHTNFTTRRKHASSGMASSYQDSSPLATREGWGEISIVPRDIPSVAAAEVTPEAPGSGRSTTTRKSFGFASRLGSSVGSRLRAARAERNQGKDQAETSSLRNLGHSEAMVSRTEL